MTFILNNILIIDEALLSKYLVDGWMNGFTDVVILLEAAKVQSMLSLTVTGQSAKVF